MESKNIIIIEKPNGEVDALRLDSGVLCRDMPTVDIYIETMVKNNPLNKYYRVELTQI